MTSSSAVLTRGLTLRQYAEAKVLPVEFLRSLGLTDEYYSRAPAVKIPYLGVDGEEISVRFRTALSGDDRFRWRSKSKPVPYGLWKLEAAIGAGELVLVEGESDTQTLWHHGIEALGLPGATTWRDEDASRLNAIERLYAVIEPDRGGQQLLESLSRSRIRERVLLVRLEGFKDVSDAHVAGRFRDVWTQAIQSAVPLLDHVSSDRERRKKLLWADCRDLAGSPAILDQFYGALQATAVVGEERAAKLLYLVLTSRLLDSPVSAIMKGPSSAGKSFITDRVISFFPESATHVLSAMSERALAYSDVPLQHRILVLYEAAALQGGFATYLVRSLLSEGRVRYETVEKTDRGLEPRVIDRPGPTGLIVTTTRIRLEPELETRMLSIAVNDSPEQTRAILGASATNGGSEADFGPWIALQEWLELSERRVLIPFAPHLSKMIPPVAVRLRRDFPTLLSLVQAHAVLHQASREKDAEGQIIADLVDYRVVRELVADLFSYGVEAAVPPEVRETVRAVDRLQPAHPEGVLIAELASALDLDESTVRRRVLQAGRYLKNLEQKRSKPKRLIIGEEPLPEDQELLPTVEALCTRARKPEGYTTPPSPSDVVRKGRTLRVLI